MGLMELVTAVREQLFPGMTDASYLLETSPFCYNEVASGQGEEMGMLF